MGASHLIMILNETLRSILGTHSELEPKGLYPPVFITGCMRSGTTMLVNKLTQHPQLLKIGGELNNIWSEIGGAPVYPSNAYRDAFHFDVGYANNMSAYFSRSIEDAKSFKRHMMRAVYRWKTGGGRISYDWDHLHVVNKSPHLINKIGYLNALYPSSKIILIVRPLEEQVASLKMHYLKTGQLRAMPMNEKDGWRDPSNEANADRAVFPNDFEALPGMWIRLNKVAIDSLKQMDKNQYFVVDYTAFVEEQDQVLKALFSFLDLDERHRSMESAIVKSGIKVFNTSTSGNPREKWKKHLTEREKEVVADIRTMEKSTISEIEAFVQS